MIGTRDNQVLLCQRFGSFAELATLARQWNADFRQLSIAESDHLVVQVMIDGLLMSRGRFGCHLQQYGETPPGSRTFALLEEDCSPVYWFGRQVGPNELLIFPADGEIQSISRPGFCTHTFSANMDDLEDFFERAGGPDLHRLLGPEATAIPLAPSHLRRLREHLRRVSFDPRALQQSLLLYDAYRDKLFNLLLAIFRDRTGPGSSPGTRTRRNLIQDIVREVENHRDERITLKALSAAGQVPERTLSAVFRRELGITPAAFIKGYRLFGTHRELWRADPTCTHVSDVANSWGFWHLGQFAADYQRFFGELPRDTLKRQPGTPKSCR
jgi:AraC-like DNA-binding protein